MSKTRRVVQFTLSLIGWGLLLVGLWPMLTEQLPVAKTGLSPDHPRWGTLLLGGAVLALSLCFKLRESRRLHRAEQREMQEHRRRIRDRQ